MSELTRYNPVDDCSGMYEDEERGGYVDYFEAKAALEAKDAKIAELEALTMTSCDDPKDCLGPLVKWDSPTQRKCLRCQTVEALT